MNSVIFKYYGFINGSLFYAFEYFLVAWDTNKNIELILIDYDPIIRQVLEDRYVLPPEVWASIHKYTRRDLLANYSKWDKVLLVDYSSIGYVKGLLDAEILVISNTATKLIKGTYYSEMPFFYGRPYTIKFAFSFYKKLSSVKVRSLSVYLKGAGGYGFRPNFFESFDTYNYVVQQGRWDAQPRLLLEAAFYNKKITYANPSDLKDGSYYRYKDLIANGLTNRYLDSTDEIIKTLSNDT